MPCIVDLPEADLRKVIGKKVHVVGVAGPHGKQGTLVEVEKGRALVDFRHGSGREHATKVPATAVYVRSQVCGVLGIAIPKRSAQTQWREKEHQMSSMQTAIGTVPVGSKISAVEGGTPASAMRAASGKPDVVVFSEEEARKLRTIELITTIEDMAQDVEQTQEAMKGFQRELDSKRASLNCLLIEYRKRLGKFEVLAAQPKR